MPQSKRTPKKKSGSNSPQIQPPKGLRIFDVVGGEKLLGKVVAENAHEITINWPAILRNNVIPVDGGKRFQLKLRLEPIFLVHGNYKLSRMGIRGECLYDHPDVPGMYAEFVRLGEAGAFRLGPLLAPQVDRLTAHPGAVGTSAAEKPLDIATGDGDNTPPSEVIIETPPEEPMAG